MLGEEVIHNVKEYLAVIKETKEASVSRGNYEDFLFRGQDGDLPLIPKIARLKPKGNLLSIEERMLKEFKRTNPLLIETQRPYDDWDYLTLGQHFGLPTRLLDWSNNALTALWFATGNPLAERQLRTNPVVWILVPESADLVIDTEQVHPFDIKETRIYRPRIIKQRINNQSGVFSIQTSEEIENKQVLNESDSFKRKLLKLKIPPDACAEIREDLNSLGVNAFTIFPELEGLCAYLQWRYFY